MNSIYLRLKALPDMTGVAGAAVMALFGGLSAWRCFTTGSLFFGLLLFRDLIMSQFFLKRKTPIRRSSGAVAALAYLSTLLPLFYQVPSKSVTLGAALSANVLFLTGFLLFTLATIELGPRIGVAPAFRDSVCRSGVYQYFRHPMYIGYIISEAGWVIINTFNVGLFLISVSCYFFRMNAENVYLRKR